MDESDGGGGDEEDGNPKIYKSLIVEPPIRLHKSATCGNYFVASRLILTGELIFEENSISDAAYGFPHTRPDCLACYKDLSYSQKCKICRWPTCNRVCSEAPNHADYECRILAKNRVQYKPDFAVLEYFSIEVMRCLLIREKCAKKWEQIQKLESHSGLRMNKAKVLIQIAHIVHFIRVRCKLIQFSEEVIIQILGIICVNAFSGITFAGRCVSLLFAQASLFNHDCSPNTSRQFWEEPNNNNNESTALDSDSDSSSLKFSIQFVATKQILPGEVISTYYGDLSDGIVERGRFLSEHYFFHCDCVRCRCELFNEVHYSVTDC